MSESTRNPATMHLLQFFRHDHLPEELAQISIQCHLLAYEMTKRLPDGPELTVGLRKLLEAKDCFVRAALPERQEETPDVLDG